MLLHPAGDICQNCTFDSNFPALACALICSKNISATSCVSRPVTVMPEYCGIPCFIAQFQSHQQIKVDTSRSAPALLANGNFGRPLQSARHDHCQPATRLHWHEAAGDPTLVDTILSLAVHDCAI